MKITESFKGKTVLITGHTGFKGSWLTLWMHLLGAKVVGLSDTIPTSPSHFEELGLGSKVKDLRIDIKDKDLVALTLNKVQPDFIFHLAAQAIVNSSFIDPINTWQTNLFGTLNLLEAFRSLQKKSCMILITSDKCYENQEWTWGYREIDRLGGSDPYSASKAATEVAIKSYIESYFSNQNEKLIAIGRAGNVIGGGDWAPNRIVPDLVRAWSSGKNLEIRKPESIRPWQHVLEPLSGYISLAIQLSENPNLHGEAFNFGPRAEQNYSVIELVEEMSKYWDKVKWKNISPGSNTIKESDLLKLNCDKALNELDWSAVFNFSETVENTVRWYKDFYENKNIPVSSISKFQITSYMEKARIRGLNWAN